MQIPVDYVSHRGYISVRHATWQQRCEEQLARIDQRVEDINRTIKELFGV